jgi:hypothetical protein
MSFSRPIQWYHSYADPIWPDGTFNQFHFILYQKVVLKLHRKCKTLLQCKEVTNALQLVEFDKLHEPDGSVVGVVQGLHAHRHPVLGRNHLP